MTMIARDYNAQLLSPTGKCGLGGDNFIKAMKEVIEPLFGAGGPINYDWLNFRSTQFVDWQIAPMTADPLDNPNLCCVYDYPKLMHGLSLVKPSDFQNDLWHPISHPNGDIGESYVPGVASFLGGSGMAITAKSKKPAMAWKFLQLSTIRDHSTLANTALKVMSPYLDVMEDNAAWSSPVYDILKMQFKKAVPVQYPQGSFPQFGYLEEKKPARLLLAEVHYKSLAGAVDSRLLVDRMCAVIDDIMLKPCTADHMQVSDQGCDSTNLTRMFSYSFKNSSSCRGGLLLEMPTVVNCSYIPANSSLAVVLSLIAGVFLLVFLALLFVIYFFRHTQAFKLSSPPFMAISIVGCALCTASVLVMPGNPIQRICGVEFWLLAYGFGLAVGSLIMKVPYSNSDSSHCQSI